MLEERVSEWKNDYICQGWKQGREEGMALGMEQGREQGMSLGQEKGMELALLDALETRFGSVPQTVSDYLKIARGTEVLRRLVRCVWQAASLEEFLELLENEKH